MKERTMGNSRKEILSPKLVFVTKLYETADKGHTFASGIAALY